MNVLIFFFFDHCPGLNSLFIISYRNCESAETFPGTTRRDGGRETAVSCVYNAHAVVRVVAFEILHGLLAFVQNPPQRFNINIDSDRADLSPRSLQHTGDDDTVVRAFLYRRNNNNNIHTIMDSTSPFTALFSTAYLFILFFSFVVCLQFPMPFTKRFYSVQTSIRNGRDLFSFCFFSTHTVKTIPVHRSPCTRHCLCTAAAAVSIFSRTQ